jgi:hypothetical protein
VQTVRHRDYFLPVGGGKKHMRRPPNRIALVSAGLLLVSLVAVVALAKVLTPTRSAACSCRCTKKCCGDCDLGTGPSTRRTGLVPCGNCGPRRPV